MKKILWFLIINILFSQAILANWLIDRDKNVPYIRQNDYKDFGLSACAPTSTAMVLQYYFPNSYISNGQIYHAGTQSHYYIGPMKYYKNISFQTCSASVAATGICISDTGKNIINKDGKQYFHGTYSGTVFSNIQSYLENNWRATVSTVITDYNHIEEALRDTPLIANVHVCGVKFCKNGSICKNGHYLVIHNIDDSGTPNNTDDDYFIVNDPEPNCGVYAQKRNGKNKKIAVNTFLNTWLKGSVYKITFPNNNNRILVEPSHSNIDGYPNGTSLEKYETYDYTNYTDKFDTTKTSFEAVGHAMKIEDEDTDDIMYYSRAGKSLIYLKKGSDNTDISTVLWKPKLVIDGYYKIEYTTLDNGAKDTLTFEVVGNDAIVKKSTNIQYDNKNIFIKKTLFESIKLNDGDYIRVESIPQDINLGSILFVKTNNTNISYPDTKNIDDEYKKAIDYLSNTLPIFSGYKDGAKKGYFGVGDNISRAEIAKILTNMLKYIMPETDIKKTTKADIKKRYTDWQDPEWFMDYARVVTEMNIMTGYFKEKKLKPKNPVSYRELSKMLGYTFFHDKTFKAHWYDNTSLEKYLWHKTYYNCFNNEGKGYTYIDDSKTSYTITNIFKRPKISRIPGLYFSERDLKAKREDVALFLYRAYMLWKNKLKTGSCIVDEENKIEGWGL